MLIRSQDLLKKKKPSFKDAFGKTVVVLNSEVTSTLLMLQRLYGALYRARKKRPRQISQNCSYFIAAQTVSLILFGSYLWSHFLIMERWFKLKNVLMLLQFTSPDPETRAKSANANNYSYEKQHLILLVTIWYYEM